MSFKHRKLMAGSTGLNNAIDPHRHYFDDKVGLKEMAAAVNVDVDSRMRVSRRKGYTNVLIAVGAHSLFSVGQYALYVAGNALTVMEKDYSTTPIRNVSVGARMSYANTGDKVYYANGFETGYVSNRLSYAWTAAAYVGPQTNKEFTAPPIGNLLSLYRGRMYVVRGSVAYYSEPFAYSWFNEAYNYFALPGAATMFHAVDDGFFVGTADEIWYFGGVTPNEIMPRRVADYGVIAGTAAVVVGRQLNEVVQSKNVLFMATPKGVCMGLDGGVFANLTEQKLVIPSSTLGAGGYLGDKYIFTLEP